MNLSRRLKMALFAGAASLTLGGCMVSAEPAARVSYYRHEPVYYDGYVVHYDRVGPYVYAGRTPRYVPRQHPRYSEIVRRAPRRYRHHYD
jgi:hypothetical protein